MASKNSNKNLYIDQEAIYTLSMLKEGILDPVTSLMDEQTAIEVDKTKLYKGKSFPFSFILAPSGKKNHEILGNIKKGETLNLIEVKSRKHYGTITVDGTFPIDPVQRVKNIFGTKSITNQGVKNALRRIGRIAVHGDYNLEFDKVRNIKEKIDSIKESKNIKNVKAIMMEANPLHRIHERVIRMSLERSELVVIFLLKPYKEDNLSYEIRENSLNFFIKNFLPMNSVIVVPLENTYIFSGNNEFILNAIVAKNFGCSQLTLGQNNNGLGLFYDDGHLKSIFDTLKGIDIEIDIKSEYIYCEMCKTIVSTKTCPHGQHHHIHYNSDAILELLENGILPPAILMRKEISALILNQLLPDRFKNLEKLFSNLLPVNAILQNHTEEEFYVKLMDLYQTTSLT
jgi:sulfate adenylyltransferase